MQARCGRLGAMSTRARTRLIQSNRELRALASTVRLALVERLDLDGPASVRELAAGLGRTPSSLYHHVAVLERAGLLVERERRRVARREEAVYALAANRLRLARRGVLPAGRAALAQIGAALLRHTGRAYVRSLEDAATALDGPRREAVLRLLTLRLPVARLREFNGDLDAFIERWSKEPPTAEARGYRLALVLTPAEPRAGARSRQSTRSSRDGRQGRAGRAAGRAPKI